MPSVTRNLGDLAAFMEDVARVSPRASACHLGQPQSPSGRGRVAGVQCRRGGRFVFHETPLHAGWANQIELLIGIDSRQVLRCASHTSVQHLREHTQDFMS